MKRLVGVALAAAGLAASPAQAQTRPIEFDVEGMTFSMLPPAGYCDHGPGVDGIRDLESKAGAPHTDVILLRCGDTLDGALLGYMIRVQRRSAPVTLEQMFEAYKRKPEWAPFAPKIGAPEAAISALRRALGAQLKLNASFAPVGFDEKCAYLAGTTRSQLDPTAPVMDVAAISCTTVVKGHGIVVIHMQSSSDVDKALAATSDLRRLVDSIH